MLLLLLEFLFHHPFYLLLSDGLGSNFVPYVKLEGHRHSNSVSAFTIAIFAHVVGTRHTLRHRFNAYGLESATVTYALILRVRRIRDFFRTLSFFLGLSIGLLFLLHAHLVSLVIFLLLKLVHESLHPSLFLLLLNPLIFLFFFSESTIFIRQKFNLLSGQRFTTLREVLYDSVPSELLIVLVAFHPIEHLLESLFGQSRGTFRISGQCSC